MVNKLIRDTQAKQLEEQLKEQLDQLYRAELIKRLDNSTCYEVYDRTVETDQLENLLKTCVQKGGIK